MVRFLAFGQLMQKPLRCLMGKIKHNLKTAFATVVRIQYIADGTIAAHRIVTHAMPLSDFGAGIDLVHDQGASLKVVLTP